MQLLHEKGIEPEVIEYLKTPPDKVTLKIILEQLGLTPRQLMRTNEQAYKDYGLDDPSLSDDELIDAMIAHPILIERPIVLTEKGAALGRPPETVQKVL